jgi:predicted RNA-binding Zn-ribbon protein involved in translation (DUF1610 family)
MPIQVTCTSCSGAFKAPDSAAGKKAKCPQCATVIEIPGGDPAEEILDAEEAMPHPVGDSDLVVEPSRAALAAGDERRPCPMCGEMIQRNAVKCRFCGEIFDKSMAQILGGQAPNMQDPRWSKVRTGLATLYYSFIILFFSIIAIAVARGVGAAMNPGRPNAEPSPAMLLLLTLGGLVIIGAAIGVLVGYVFCTNVPEVSGARGFAVGTIVCLVANMLLNVFGGTPNLAALRLLGSLVAVIGSVLFILFIRTTATYLGNLDLAKSALRFLIVGGIYFAGCFALGVVAGIGKLPALLGVLGLFFVIAGLVAFVWILRLLQKLMKTIDQRTIGN